MKKIVLLGDSIRKGYEPTVRQELDGQAEVWAPEANGQHTINLLMFFMEWIANQQPDILHLNAGLWDTRKVARDVVGNVVQLSLYRENIARLLQLTKQFTKAKIIWATTTPVNHEKNMAHAIGNGRAGRATQEIAIYNAAAVEEARKAGAQINDLHQFVLDHDPDAIRLPDGVHYTPEGYALLGRHVAGMLKKHL